MVPLPPLTARQPRRARPVAVLFALLGAATASLIAPMPAHAVDNGTLGIRPAHESTFFHLHAYPGETLTNSAIVSNHTSKPVTLLDYPVDAHSSATGTFAMAAQTDMRTTVGAWTRLAVAKITVPAGSERPLPFRLHIPAGTAPGDYAGALIIQSPTVIGKTSTHNGTAVRLNVIQRQGLRIYLHVDGTATKTLTAGTLTWTDTGDGTGFSLPVHNTGNTTLHPTATLTLASRIGANTRIRFTSPEALLPGDELTLHATLTHPATIQVGTATATVYSEAGQRTITASYVQLPWTAIKTGGGILILALIALLALAWRRRRTTTHRNRRQQHTHTDVLTRARHRAHATP